MRFFFAVPISAALLTSALAASAVAGATIGIYSDSGGSLCSFSANQGGPITAYVVVKPDGIGIRGVRFSAPIPSCFDATFLYESTPELVVSIGSSQTGISVSSLYCETAPFAVLQVTYLDNGGTLPCCEFPIVADPFVESIEGVGCDYATTAIQSVVTYFNADDSCACGTSPPAIPPPLAPSDPTPPDGAAFVSVDPTLTWLNEYPADLPLWCDVYLGTDANPPLFTSNLQTAGGGTVYRPGHLVDETTYFWRVVVRNSALQEATGPVWRFSTSPNSPPVIENASPANGAAVVPLAPTLTWRAVDPENEPMTYDVYFGTNATPPLVATGVTTKSYAPGSLAYRARYWWRVVVRDSKGQEASGPVWSFITRALNEPPAIPSDPYPVDRATEVPLLNPSLVWRGSDPEGQPLNYDVYFGPYVSPATATIGLYSDVAGASCSFSGNAPGVVTAYVVVQPGSTGLRGVAFAAPIPDCFDATFLGETLPQEAGWSGTSQTGMQIYPNYSLGGCVTLPTRVLTITYLTNGATIPCCAFPIVADPRIGSLRAADCSNNITPLTPMTSHFNAGTSCECQAGNMPPLVAGNRSQTSYAPPGSLQLGTRYQWRVVARDTGELTTSSPLWIFTARQNQPPNLPSNPSPTNFATNQPTNATLSWECSDPEGHAITYDMYFGPKYNPPKVASNLASTAYDPGPLQFNTWYYWRVVARDSLGAQISSNQWSFWTTVGNRPPAAASERSPANGATNQLLNTGVKWYSTDPDNDPLNYDVYFGPEATPPLVADHITVRTYDPELLDEFTTYRWKIVVRDAPGHETESPVWSFTTGNVYSVPPLVPSHPNPPDNGVGSTSPLLSWEATDPDGNALTYYVFMYLNDPFGTLLGTTPNPYFQVQQELVPGWEYYWRVMAYDGHWYISGPTWRFTVHGAELPVTFEKFDARQSGLAIEIKWELASDGALEDYKLYRSENRHGDAREIARGRVDGSTDTYLDTSVEPGRTYSYELLIRASDGDEFRSQIATVTMAKLELALHQNVPNPFNPQTTIRYDLPDAGRVRLLVFDVNGRLVRVLVEETQTPGLHEVTWTGRDDAGNAVSSGIYFCVLDAGKDRLTKKLVLLK